MSRPTLIDLLRSTRDLIDHYEPGAADLATMADLNRCLNDAIAHLEASDAQR